MNRSARKFVGYVRLVVSLLVVFCVAVGLYYLQTERRASYFEQLRYRQLKEFVQNFDNNLSSLRSVTREHAQLLERDLEALRTFESLLSELRKHKPFQHPKFNSAKLIEAQASLLVFGDRTTARGEESKVEDKACSCTQSTERQQKNSLYDILLERAKLRELQEKTQTNEKCLNDRETIECHEDDIREFGNSMNVAGHLARVPLSDLGRANYEYAEEHIRKLIDLEHLDQICTTQKIRGNLLAALQRFYSFKGTFENAGPGPKSPTEKLSEFIQDQIEDFWSGKLRDAHGDREFRIRQFKAIAESASAAEIMKSHLALTQLIRLVESRYLDESSPLASSVEKHRLKLKYELSPESDATRICKAQKSTALFLFPTVQSGPYSVGNYSLGACAQRASVAYTAPLENFLNSDMDEFSVILVADPVGNVLYNRHRRTTHSGQTFLNVRALISQIERASSSNGVDAATIEQPSNQRSDPRNLDFGGVNYRLYILPHKLSGDGLLSYDGASTNPGSKSQHATVNRVYLIGMIPTAQVKSEKYSLSAVSTVVLLTLSVTILLLFVFLKIRWVPLTAAFTGGDRRIAAISIVSMVLLGSIIWVCLLVSQQMTKDFSNDADYAIREMRDRFRDDLSLTYQLVSNLQNDDRFLNVLLAKKGPENWDYTDYKDLECDAEAREILIKSRSEEAGSMFGQPTVAWYLKSCGKERVPIDNIFVLNNKGRIYGELIRGTDKLVSPVLDPNLSERKYFRKAIADETWNVDLADGPASEVSSNELPIFIERIFNIVNGSLTTQFAIPVSQLCFGKDGARDAASPFSAFCNREEVNTEAESRPQVLSFGVTIKSLLSPLLPNRFNYAVLDNENGLVLYHSNPTRSLVENFLQETENNSELLAYLRNANVSMPITGRKPIEFDGQYRGARTQFYAQQLHSNIPWTLVVFHEIEYAQAFTALLFSLSLVIALSVLVLVAGLAFLIKLFAHDIFVWLWPDIDLEKWYRATTVKVLVASAVLCVALSLVSKLWVLAVLVTVSLIMGMGILSRSFKRYRIENCSTVNRGSTKKVTFLYTAFALSLLIFAVAIPTVFISNKVGVNLLDRLELYDGLIIKERLKERKGIVKGHMNRRSDKWAPSVDDTSYVYIHSVTDAIGSNPRQNAVLARTQVAPSSEHDEATTQCCLINTRSDAVFDRALALIANVWEPAKLLEASWKDDKSPKQDVQAAPKNEASQPNRTSETLWALDYRYPSLFALSFTRFGAVVLLCYLAILTGIYFLVRFLATHLLGMSVPRSYRTDPAVMRLTLSSLAQQESKTSAKPGSGLLAIEHNKSATESLAAALANPLQYPHCALLIRPLKGELELSHVWVNDSYLGSSQYGSPIDIANLVSDDERRCQLLGFTRQGTVQPKVLLLSNIESVAFTKTSRLLLLEFLETVVYCSKRVSIVVLCDVSPLYMLTKQSQYLPVDSEAEFASAQEIVRWSRLLSQFKKYYDWSPSVFCFDDQNELNNILLREITIWPNLYELAVVFATIKGAPESPLSEEQIIQFVGAHAGAEYRRRWSLCTRDERLILYQLANGLMMNTRNIEPLEHLMRRGYIVRNPRWSIANQSFARFVRTAESEAVYLDWMEASQRGLWQFVKVPLIGFAFAALGIIIYSTQEGINSVLALATGILTLIPLLLRNLSLVKGAGEGQAGN